MLGQILFISSVLEAMALPKAQGLSFKKMNSRQLDPSDPYTNWPSYDQLPLDASYPTKAAWGVWGANDTTGALNHINASTVLSAKSEIQQGQTFNLNLQLAEPFEPINPNRKPLVHLYQPGDGYTDDVVMMNTQISTQFDGLRHFPYSTNNSIETYQWYNNLIGSYDDVIGPEPTTVLGLQQAAERGIAGRGVLLDFAGWATTQGLNFSAFSNYSITTAQLDQVAQWQGLTQDWSSPGDMLFVRTGWLEQYNALSPIDQYTVPRQKDGPGIGILASDETLRWLWEKKLALVGADNPAFESLPFDKDIDGVPRSLHQVFIGGWGQSILEFLDLEDLASALHSQRRSTFFVTITVLNVLSGIASPPNAVAIL
jgi:hypothetical protein